MEDYLVQVTHLMEFVKKKVDSKAYWCYTTYIIR